MLERPRPPRGHDLDLVLVVAEDELAIQATAGVFEDQLDRLVAGPGDRLDRHHGARNDPGRARAHRKVLKPRRHCREAILRHGPDAVRVEPPPADEPDDHPRAVKVPREWCPAAV